MDIFHSSLNKLQTKPLTEKITVRLLNNENNYQLQPTDFSGSYNVSELALNDIEVPEKSNMNPSWLPKSIVHGN